MNAFYAGVHRIVDHSVINSARVQFLKALICLRMQLFQVAELNRLCGTGVSTGWLESGHLAVSAEGAFEGATVVLILLDHSERATDNAVSAAIANVGLNEDSAELHAHDGASGASFQTAGDLAMLADVGREAPGRQLPGRVSTQAGSGGVLDKLHMTPGGVADGFSVVVREAAPVVAVFGNAVPFLARDLASFAADAQRGIGEEAGVRVAVGLW